MYDPSYTDSSAASREIEAEDYKQAINYIALQEAGKMKITKKQFKIHQTALSKQKAVVHTFSFAKLISESGNTITHDMIPSEFRSKVVRSLIKSTLLSEFKIVETPAAKKASQSSQISPKPKYLLQTGEEIRCRILELYKKKLFNFEFGKEERFAEFLNKIPPKGTSKSIILLIKDEETLKKALKEIVTRMNSELILKLESYGKNIITGGVKGRFFQDSSCKRMTQNIEMIYDHVMEVTDMQTICGVMDIHMGLIQNSRLKHHINTRVSNIKTLFSHPSYSTKSLTTKSAIVKRSLLNNIDNDLNNRVKRIIEEERDSESNILENIERYSSHAEHIKEVNLKQASQVMMQGLSKMRVQRFEFAHDINMRASPTVSSHRDIPEASVHPEVLILSQIDIKEYIVDQFIEAVSNKGRFTIHNTCT